MKNPDKHVQFSFVKSQSNIFSIFGQDRPLSDLSLRSQSTIDVRLHLHDLDRHVTSLYVYLFICYFEPSFWVWLLSLGSFGFYDEKTLHFIAFCWVASRWWTNELRLNLPCNSPRVQLDVTLIVFVLSQWHRISCVRACDALRSFRSRDLLPHALIRIVSKLQLVTQSVIVLSSRKDLRSNLFRKKRVVQAMWWKFINIIIAEMNIGYDGVKIVGMNKIV